MKSKNNGFTLIELLIAIAIISIMASVVMISIPGYRATARSSKAQAQLSSAIPNMIACWGNAKTVKNPVDSGGAICREPGMGGVDIPSYGYYPDISGGDLANYSYDQIDMTNNSWHFGMENASDSKSVCCNVKMKSCKIIDDVLTTSNCTDDLPAN